MFTKRATLVYLLFLSFLELIVYIVCRWLIKINQLLYSYMLEKLYIKFIHIFAVLRYKMYKKILCQLKGWMVNQQVTLYNGTSETACDITFKFKNYLDLKVKHKKKKINKRFLEWFIGFTEGKDCFIILNNKVYFNISVNIKDIQVIYPLRSPPLRCFVRSTPRTTASLEKTNYGLLKIQLNRRVVLE